MCQRSGVNVWDGVNLKQDVTGSKLMWLGDITRTRMERGEAKQNNTLTINLSIVR